MKEIKSTGWVAVNDLQLYKNKITGNRLLDIYFQRTKPNVFRKGEKLKMIKITLLARLPTNKQSKDEIYQLR